MKLMDRRELLHRGVAGAGLLGLAAIPGRAAAQAGSALFAPPPLIVPIRASVDRIFRVTVCLRPFRAAGPRIAVEQVGRKRVVHHYGHGGSGWSLSWGSALEAVPLALADGVTDIAVIGAGAIGLTTAITAQRMGANVTIYAKERFPLVRSARATGTWSPDSRVAMAGATTPDFGDQWERMARASFAFHQRFLGMAGDPVEFSERYSLSDGASPQAERADDPARPSFAALEHRIADLTPRAETLAPGTHPFPTRIARRTTAMTFNVADLSHQLEADFLAAGGRFVPAEFHHPSDLARIRQKVIINCTGYGARALFDDTSVIPVRGQIAWLIPQPGVTYGVYHSHVSVLARRDGIVVQPLGADDYFGYDDANEQPDYPAAYAGVEAVAALFRPRAAPAAAPA
jgi:glycine/D-amino acid oxidase-like deaminating enzyme